MYFLIKNNKLLEKYSRIRDKVSKSIKKRFDSEPVYNEKYVKTKTKSCEGKINTNSHDDKVPKEGSKYICLSVMLIDFLLRTGKNYYLQKLLEEFKYIAKEKKDA